MYDLKKSDAVIVAVKQANNGRQRLAESVEQKAAAEENPEGQMDEHVMRQVVIAARKSLEEMGVTSAAPPLRALEERAKLAA